MRVLVSRSGWRFHPKVRFSDHEAILLAEGIYLDMIDRVYFINPEDKGFVESSSAGKESEDCYETAGDRCRSTSFPTRWTDPTSTELKSKTAFHM